VPSYIYTHTTLLTSPSHDSQRQRSSSNAAAADPAPPPPAADPASPTGQDVAGMAPEARAHV